VISQCRQVNRKNLYLALEIHLSRKFINTQL
jgi:hypothetical protein